MFMQESISKAAGASEGVTCVQPLQTRIPISPPLKKRKTPRYEDVEEPARAVLQDSLIMPKCEPEECIIDDVSFADDDEMYNSVDDKSEIISTLKNSVSESSNTCSTAQNLQGSQHVKGKIELYLLFIIIIHY